MNILQSCPIWVQGNLCCTLLETRKYHTSLENLTLSRECFRWTDIGQDLFLGETRSRNTIDADTRTWSSAFLRIKLRNTQGKLYETHSFPCVFLNSWNQDRSRHERMTSFEQKNKSKTKKIIKQTRKIQVKG